NLECVCLGWYLLGRYGYQGNTSEPFFFFISPGPANLGHFLLQRGSRRYTRSPSLRKGSSPCNLNHATSSNSAKRKSSRFRRWATTPIRASFDGRIHLPPW